MVKCLFLISAAALPAYAAADTEPQTQASLAQMLTIDWSAGVHMPQGMQDNVVDS